MRILTDIELARLRVGMAPAIVVPDMDAAELIAALVWLVDDARACAAAVRRQLTGKGM